MDFNELVISNDTELVVNSLLKSILGLLEPFCSKVQHPAKYLLLQELDGYRVVDIDWYHCPTSQKKSFAISIRDPASARPYNHHHPHFFSTSTQSPNTSAKYATIYNPCLPISPHKAQNQEIKMHNAHHTRFHITSCTWLMQHHYPKYQPPLRSIPNLTSSFRQAYKSPPPLILLYPYYSMH